MQASLRLAGELGPDRLTTATVARNVGLTQPAIFRHFATKQDLWDAITDYIGKTMEAGWAEAAQCNGTPAQRLRCLVAVQLRLIQSTPAIPAILFSRELHSRNVALRKALFGLMRRFGGLVARCIAQARDVGEFRDDLDPDDAALLIIGLIQGLALRWSLSGRAFGLAKEGGRLLDIQLRGFAPLPATTTRNRRPR
ncbi:transcriptional regulator, TetR family [Enhydrobacter aerosaccus]|uniref:Transcriptional regulator, TetR family n=1 Tax=Enhydrobacter aerosaccus TaxID=225324 RepID=A0A1T4SA44_9HYPH|nr:transcriptional regulator, TetR family [Enhydrobacter aerosaccus]